MVLKWKSVRTKSINWFHGQKYEKDSHRKSNRMNSSIHNGNSSSFFSFSLSWIKEKSVSSWEPNIWIFPFAFIHISVDLVRLKKFASGPFKVLQLQAFIFGERSNAFCKKMELMTYQILLFFIENLHSLLINILCRRCVIFHSKPGNSSIRLNSVRREPVRRH